MSTIKVDTVRPVTADASLTLQGDSGGSGVTGLTIDSSGVVNTTTAKVTNIQATSGQSLTIKDEDGNAAITLGTDNTAASYLSLNFGSYHGDSGGAGSGTLTGNTLNDYEQGTWETGLNDSSGNETTGTVIGYYTKVGNLCFCGFESFNNIVTTTGSASPSDLISDDVACFKLPFTSTSRAGAHTLRTDSLTWPTGSGSITGTVEGNLFKLRRSTSGQSDSSIIVSNFTSGTTDVVDFALIYTVS